MKNTEKDHCGAMHGMLPACGMLAVPYVPFQPEGSETYDVKTALVRGTLFPDLDLPFMGMINDCEKTDTPLHELQAVNFAVNELGLYLDTHKDDEEALELFRKYVQMYHQGLMQYEKLYGPLTRKQAGISGKYDWLSSPWPWEYDANKEG